MKKLIIIVLMSFSSVFGYDFEVEYLTTDIKGSCYNGQALLCYGSYGIIFKTEDLGNNWKKINIDHRVNFIGGFFESSKFYIFSSNRVYSSDDNGENWKLIFSDNTDSIRKVLITNDTLILFSNKNIKFVYKGNEKLIETNKILVNAFHISDKYYILDNLDLFEINLNNNNFNRIDKFNLERYYIESSYIDSTNVSYSTKKGIYSFNIHDQSIIKLDTAYKEVYIINDKSINYPDSEKGKSINGNDFTPSYIYSFKVYNKSLNATNVIGFDKNQQLITERIVFTSYSKYGDMQVITGNFNFIAVSINNGVDWIIHNYYSNYTSNLVRNGNNIYSFYNQKLVVSKDNGITWRSQSSNSNYYLESNSFRLGIFDKNDKKVISANTYRNDIKSAVFLDENHKLIDTSINNEALYLTNQYKSVFFNLGDSLFEPASYSNEIFNRNGISIYKYGNSAKSEYVAFIDSCILLNSFKKDNKLFMVIENRKNYDSTLATPVFYDKSIRIYSSENGRDWAFYDTLPSQPKLIDNYLYYYPNYPDDKIIEIYDVSNKNRIRYTIDSLEYTSLVYSEKLNQHFYILNDSTIRIYDKENKSKIASVKFKSLLTDWVDDVNNQNNDFIFNSSSFYLDKNLLIEGNSFILQRAKKSGVLVGQFGTSPEFRTYLIRLTPKITNKIEDEFVNNYFYNLPPFPNPSSSIINVKFYIGIQNNVSNNNFSIYDMYSSKIECQTYLQQLDNFIYNVSIDCKNLNSGLYFLRVFDGIKFNSVPFMVSK